VDAVLYFGDGAGLLKSNFSLKQVWESNSNGVAGVRAVLLGKNRFPDS
jgi:hypothetical protein